jgi:GcrA cell cycle regulator
MWLEGKSASEIAKELGEITRNAVIGKVHRLGLSNREIKSLKGGTEENDLKNVKKKRSSS